MRARRTVDRTNAVPRAWPLLGVLALVTCGWDPPGSSTSGDQAPATPSSANDGGQPAPSAGADQPPQGPPGYRLVWSDEFSGSALDASRWTALSDQRHDALNTPNAVSVSGGTLAITTYTEGGLHYTGFLSSEGKAAFTFGYFEARIRLHGAPGSWCAFWLNSPTNGDPLNDPAAAGTEIDIMENRVVDESGNDVSNTNVVNVHWNGYGADHQQSTKLAFGSPSLQDNWHTYAVLWTATGYTYYLDGNAVWTPAANVPVSRHAEDVFLSCEVQDQAWSGNIPAGGYGSRASSTTRVEVDWIRVWQAGA